MTTTSPANATVAPDAGSLIAFLWPRVRDVYAALMEALRTDGDDATALALQFRTQVLLLASQPACDWTEVESKVVIQAMLRNDRARGLVEADPHLDSMLEAAIIADHAALNGV